MNVEGLRVSAKRATTIGEFIREQREQAQVSLRQLRRRLESVPLADRTRAAQASADILQQIAKGLRISAEQLYVRAGILESRHGDPELVAAILADSGLIERQKQALIDIYETFRREHASGDGAAAQENAAARTTAAAANGKVRTAAHMDGRRNHVDYQ
jgi:transcriptional regulator with XRE-family HTH domain